MPKIPRRFVPLPALAPLALFLLCAGCRSEVKVTAPPAPRGAGAGQAQKEVDQRLKMMDHNPTVTAEDKAKYRAMIEGATKPPPPVPANGQNPFYQVAPGGKR